MTRLLRKFGQELGYGYKILGMGGVLTPEGFNDYRQTGAMWDPDLGLKIKRSLVEQ